MASLASFALALILGGAVIAPASAAATTTVDAATITASESAMVKALNADRAAVGLVAVQVDSRLMAIARARSADMVAKNYFSHTQPDGRNVFDILTAQHLTWYNAGEIIAWNNWPIESTVAVTNSQWMGSPGHHAIIVGTDYNYVGVGLAVDATGKALWTGVFMKGPDRTAARAGMYPLSVRTGSTATTRTVRLTWSGSDPRLQVLTAGLRDFMVQRRVDGGAWLTLVPSTTLRVKDVIGYLGHKMEYRISARDKAGNRGAWVSKVIDLR